MRDMNTNQFVVLIMVAFELVACSVSVHAQQMSARRAREVLTTQKPLVSPAFSLGLVNRNSRKAAEKIYRKQIRALNRLVGSGDQTLIPLLIPYLHYTSDVTPGEIDVWRNSTVIDTKDICEKFPAFAVIISIRGVDNALAKYVLDRKNSLDYRFTAFHVLRYVNPLEFRSVQQIFNREFLGVSKRAKQRLKAIEDGTAPFDGGSSIATLINRKQNCQAVLILPVES